MRVASSTRLVALALLCVVAGGAVGSTAPAVASPGARGQVAAGDVVVADQEAGEVLRLHDGAPPTVLLEGLGAVRGVAVLPDGAVVAADSQEGTLVAVGGRFGREPVELATGLESPEAVAPAGQGRVYVTSFSEGTLATVDLDRGTVRSVAAGLDGPSAVVALRSPRPDGQVAVAQWFGGDVAAIRRSGASAADVTGGLGRPAGLATDGDGTVYVTDRARGRVVAVAADGGRRPVAELDAPAGVSLDPVAPAAGQDYQLVVATAAGVVRLDPRTGDTETIADVETGVGVAVAPDELVAAGTPTADGEGATPAAGGPGVGDQAQFEQSDGGDLDPVLVGLVAVAVFLAGVAVVSGIQLARSRGDDDLDPRRYEGLSRKERRRARSTARAVQAAERKTAKEIAKAEKRAEKLAPRDSATEPAAETVPAVDPAALFVGDPGVGATSDTGPGDGQVGRETSPPPSRKQRREQARQARVAARVEAERARRDERAAKEEAARERREAKAAAKAGQRARKGETDQPARTDDPGTATDEVAAGDAGERGVANESTAAALGPPSAPVERVPLFSTPSAPATSTPGPFLESLFSDDVPTPPGATPGSSDAAAAAADDDADDDAAETRSAVPGEQGPVTAAPPSEPEPELVSEPEPELVPAPAPDPEPVPLPARSVPTAPAVVGPSALEATGASARPVEPRVDLTEAVARDAPAPRGLRGRRRAKRRQRAAEHRHRQLRALNALLDVPPPALPPAPVRPALGVASAASVATPDQPTTPAALRAARAPGPYEVTSSPAAEHTGSGAGAETVPPVREVASGPGPSGEPAGSTPPEATEPGITERGPTASPLEATSRPDDPWAGMPPLGGDPDSGAGAGVAVPWPADGQRSPGEVPPWPDEPPG